MIAGQHTSQNNKGEKMRIIGVVQGQVLVLNGVSFFSLPVVLLADKRLLLLKSLGWKRVLLSRSPPFYFSCIYNMYIPFK